MNAIFNENTTCTLSTKELEHGVVLSVHNDYAAHPQDLLVSSLCKSKEMLLSPEEGRALAEESQREAGIKFTSKDSAEGLIRITGKASSEGRDGPMAMGLAHVGVQALRGMHPDIGDVLKLHFDLRAAHIHRMGVGMGLHTMMADALCVEVLALVERFQSTNEYDTTVIWAFDSSFASCDELGLKDRLNRALLAKIYEPMLVADDSAA